MTSHRCVALAVTAVALGGCAMAAPQRESDATAPHADKPRIVVTTDPELDDSNSLLRYLLYSTNFRTEGLVYASSQFHWKGDGTRTKRIVSNSEYTRFGPNLCPCETIHLILEATDDGAPALTRYQRFIIAVTRSKANQSSASN